MKTWVAVNDVFIVVLVNLGLINDPERSVVGDLDDIRAEH
jgi:hypothetical protein